MAALTGIGSGKALPDSVRITHTHLGSSERGSQWVRPCSWWADGCEGTGTPILFCTKFRTCSLRHWQSLREMSPVVSCSGSCIRSHRQWQNPPGSGQAGLHPKEHLLPTCKENNPQLSAGFTPFIGLHKGDKCRDQPRGLRTRNGP